MQTADETRASSATSPPERTNPTEPTSPTEPASPTRRPATRWLVPLVLWLAAALVLALAAAGIRANTSQGLPGNPATTPVRADQWPTQNQARPTTLTSPVVVAVQHSTSKRYLVEITPVSVTPGSLDDFNLADPAEVAGARVFEIRYTVRYLGGDVIGTLPEIKLRLLPGAEPPINPPNGMKNWNQSDCRAPELRRGFAFGRGTTLELCQLSFVRAGEPTTTLQLEPVVTGRTPRAVPNDVRWPTR